MIYTQDYLRIIEHTLKWEGGETFDTGGYTRFGISEKAHPETARELQGMDEEAARNVAIDVYYKTYYLPACPKISSLHVRAKYFDLCVNMGKRRATSLLQAAANKWFEAGTLRPGERLKEDGLFGRKTSMQVNAAGGDLYPFLVLEAAKYYNQLSKQPKYRVYLHGWLNRLFDSLKGE